MRLSTTTLGCLTWDLPTTVTRVRGYGLDAWHPHNAEAEVAFPAFVRQMKVWRERFAAS